MILNTALSKTRETFGRVFLVSFIECGIVLVIATVVVEEGDGAAATADVINDGNGASAVIEYGANHSDDDTSDAVVSVRTIAS